MVVVVTSNNAGGIAQFSDSLTESLNAAGVFTLEFVPHDSISKSEFARRLPGISQTDVFVRSGMLKDCVAAVVACNPEAVLLADTALVTLVMALELCDIFPVYAVIHDAKPHPSIGSSIKTKVLNHICEALSERLFRKSRGLVFLSENTQAEFEEGHGKTGKGISLRLCAHPVSCVPVMPPELSGEACDFLLFFGRIDKYKGLGRLFDLYSRPDFDLPSLVVAGFGELSRAESESLGRCKKVTLINRFISDAEMTWLFSNCKATVLPYIEASQSGVLVMSYHFGKPVVVSDLPGLTEFVDAGSTGLVFRDEAELAKCLKRVTCEDGWSQRVVDYVKENLSWEANTAKLITGMGVIRHAEKKAGSASSPLETSRE